MQLATEHHKFTFREPLEHNLDEKFKQFPLIVRSKPWSEFLIKERRKMKRGLVVTGEKIAASLCAFVVQRCRLYQRSL